MKVLYDHQIFFMQNYGGISRYFFELIHRGKKDGISDASISYSDSEYLIENPVVYYKRRPKLNFRGRERLLRWLSERKSLKEISNCDIFHPTFFDDYYIDKINRANTPFVLTIYDMINEKFPQYFPGQDRVPKTKKKLAMRADKIIAISESTKRDIIDLFQIPEEKIVVTYLSTNILEVPDYVDPLCLPKTYVLFVGKRDNYKNFWGFFEECKNLIKQADFHLVCAGGGGFTKKELDIFKNNKLEERVHYFDVRNDSLLKCLYQQASIMAFPSLYEGFGIPVLEAMSLGCPVILSDAGSFPEVGGEAGLYFSPNEKGSIGRLLEKYISNIDGRSDLSRVCLKNSKRFNWMRTYQETQKIYQNILK